MTATAPTPTGPAGNVADSLFGDDARSRLGLQLHDEGWLLDLSDIAEVIPVPELSPVPLTKPWFAGIANIRGNLVGVVDLAAHLGGAPVAQDDKTRLVVIGEKHRINAALLFSRVIGLRQLENLVKQTDNGAAAPWIGECYRDSDQRVWRSLNMHALVTHPDFLAIELYSL
jgi:twitching motility protein PilI